MYYNRKKEIIKNTIFIVAIFLIAIYSTHKIYYKFKDERNIDINSNQLEITYHQKNANKITLTKITPVSDSVGLSTTEYSFTIKNNKENTVKYNIKIEDDIETINNEQCINMLIPKDNIKISIKKNNNKDEIYYLSDLNNNIIETDTINSNESNYYSIRVWVINNTSLVNGSNLHYHGLITLEEVE